MFTILRAGTLVVAVAAAGVLGMSFAAQGKGVSHAQQATISPADIAGSISRSESPAASPRTATRRPVTRSKQLKYAVEQAYLSTLENVYLNRPVN